MERLTSGNAAPEGQEPSAPKKEHDSPEALREQLLSILSHELRTPLTPILAAVSLMQRSARLPAEYREPLEVIRRNVELEARLVDELLDLMRLDKEEVVLDLHPMDVLPLLQRIIELCRPELSARKLTLNSDLGQESLLVQADESRLQQSFWNLVRNAIKSSDAGQAIMMKCRMEGALAVIEVGAEGSGFEPEEADQIFDPFAQINKSSPPSSGIPSLALARAKRLIELHKGSICASSPGKGKGVIFRITLPLLSKPSGTLETEVSPFEGRKILLVEDHLDSAQLIKKLLESMHYEVKVVGTAAAAIAELGQDDFDLLISDIGLPDKNGADLLQELRADGYSLKAVALTGYGEQEDIEKSLSAGFCEHITKPVTIEAVEEAVKRALSFQRPA